MTTLPPLSQDMLERHLLRLFVEAEQRNDRRRKETIAPAAWDGERRRLLESYRAMLGLFPERTPLQPRVTGRLERERYAIEKVIFESQPGLLVTANLYVPRRPAPGAHPEDKLPAVLVPCGHTENGKAGETYQRVCAGLASKGYVVLIYDPIGQGERKLYWNRERGESELGGCTTQHSYAGNQWILAGMSLAQIMVWDSIRAIDYLVSRPEVDAERIAMAGNSGGGTNTAYTAPLDERIKVAVPCCYVTTLAWRRRVASTGDAEQNLLGQVPAGLDHADFLRLVAPRPVMVGSASLDYFPLEGAKASVASARALYESLGVPDRIQHAVAEETHGYSLELRRATYRWINRWLGKEEEGDDEPEAEIESDEDLRCTPEGQVATLGSEDAHTILLRRVGMQPPEVTSPLPIAERIAKLTCFERTAERPPARPAQTELVRYEGARQTERVVLWPEPDVAVPGFAFSWRGSARKRRALLWLGGEGVVALRRRGAFQTALAVLPQEGWIVLAVDVRGVGETAPRENGRPHPHVSGSEAFLAYETFVIGKPLLGMRLRDAECAAHYLLEREDVDAERGVIVVGWGMGGLLALHVATVEPRIGAVATVDTLASYRSVVEHERYAHPVSSFVPGAVRSAASPLGYDLPELVAAVEPRPVLSLRSVDHLDRPIEPLEDAQVASHLLSWLRERAGGE